MGKRLKFPLADTLEFYIDLSPEGRESFMNILAEVDSEAHANLVRELVNQVMEGVPSRILPRHPDG